MHAINGVLDEAGIQHAVMSGLHAAVLQEAATGAPHRVTNDADLWLPDAEIDRAAEVLDTQTKHGFEVSYFGGQDRTIVTVQRDGAEAELMAHMDIATPEGVYAFRMTPRVRAAAEPSIGKWNVPFVRREDSVILKALLQRSVDADGITPKHDAQDIRVLSSLRPLNMRYMDERLTEIDFDTIMCGFYKTSVQHRVMPYLGRLAAL